MQKENLYKKLMSQNNLSEEQWISLINEASHLSADFEKSNLLVQLSQKMPKTESVKSTYLKAAKTINDNGEYGKAIRVVE
jgi:predicted negative regulator of RcsB-dependent stress response